jgi:hypothetical protein
VNGKNVLVMVKKKKKWVTRDNVKKVEPERTQLVKPYGTRMEE